MGEGRTRSQSLRVGGGAGALQCLSRPGLGGGAGSLSGGVLLACLSVTPYCPQQPFGPLASPSPDPAGHSQLHAWVCSPLKDLRCHLRRESIPSSILSTYLPVCRRLPLAGGGLGARPMARTDLPWFHGPRTDPRGGRGQMRPEAPLEQKTSELAPGRDIRRRSCGPPLQ